MNTTTITRPVRQAVCVGDLAEVAAAAAASNDLQTWADGLQSITRFLGTQTTAQVTANWDKINGTFEVLGTSATLLILKDLALHARTESAQEGWTMVLDQLSS